MDEKRTNLLKIYEFQGRTLMCPHSSLKEGQIVGVILDKGIDPLNKYRFVITEEGETETASKKQLKRISDVKVVWTRKMFMTHYQEMEEIRKQSIIALKEYLIKKKGIIWPGQ